MNWGVCYDDIMHVIGLFNGKGLRKKRTLFCLAVPARWSLSFALAELAANEVAIVRNMCA